MKTGVFMRQLLALILLGTLQAASATRAVEVTDDDGRQLTFPEHPQRIVALAPGATEMLFAAGAGAQVKATVQYANEPAAARNVPRIGDVVSVDMERLVAIQPDVVVTWPGGGNTAQAEAIEKLGIPTYHQQANRLADLPDSLRRLGVLAGTSVVADVAAAELQRRLAQLASRYSGRKRPTVLLQVWSHPLYTIGGTQLVSDVIRLCGARNVFGDLRDLSPVIDIEAVIARDPDIIVAAAEPDDAARWLAEWRPFSALRAVRDHNLLAFTDQRLTRLGPSVVDAAEGFCRLLVAHGG